MPLLEVWELLPYLSSSLTVDGSEHNIILRDALLFLDNGHFVMGLGSQADMSGNTTLPVDVEIDLQQQIVLLKQELSDVKAELLLVTNKNKELIKEAKAVGRNSDTNVSGCISHL